MNLNLIEVNFIPPGFKPYGDKFGRNVGLFGVTNDNQRLLIFFLETIGRDTHPLYVAVTDPGGAVRRLAGTEGQRATDLPSEAGLSLIYHDGMWAAGRGSGEISVRDIFVRWDREFAHSVTGYGRTLTIGVRGPRELSVADLARVATSVVFEE